MTLTVADQIRETLTAFSTQSALLEQLMGAEGVNVHQDFKTTLSIASRRGLQRLAAAFHENRVIQRAYRADGLGGCLVFHLFGVSNNDELIDLDLPSVETGFTIYRTIQAWDNGRLSREVVEHFLQQELASREMPSDAGLAER